MRFQDIPQLTQDSGYAVNVGWTYLEPWIDDNLKIGLDLNPDFQRAHVWTENQQRAYVEFVLRGGKWGNQLRFNCVGWMHNFEGPFVIVDGKQRLEAARRFMRNELTVFNGHRLGDFTDKLRAIGPDFVMSVNSLETRKEVLNWYLEINSGGVIHTPEEIEKVRRMLDAEKKPRKANAPTR